jgi:RNA-directed DNA polymerase
MQEARLMIVEQSTGATSRETVDWHSIDWKKAHKIVNRLQARIVQATKEGKQNKAKALQRLLTHSFSGKALAVKRVTENQGKNTPGVDKTVWDTPEKKSMAIQELQSRGYTAQPLRRMYLPKPNGKQRPLGIPTMKDRGMQALYLQALDPIAETQADTHSYGFRKERSCADAITQCYRVLFRKDMPTWILEGDIKSCFDTISHNWLLTHIPMEQSILEKWLKAGYMEKSVWHASEDGTPQGGIISPVLANMTLDGLEKLLREKYPLKGPGGDKGRRSKVHLVRYADDFIITGSSQTLLEKEVKPLVIGFLQERGLELSQEKTKITHIADGFDFLGQNIRKYNGLLLTRPSKKNVKAFLKDIRETIKGHKQATAYGLIALLNPKIQGWANYHRYSASSKTFNYVDWVIEKAVWQWARRRHPQKSTHWIQRRYFCQIGNRNWCFFGTAKSKDGQSVQKVLCLAASTPIVRYTKIKGECNPYDPAWQPYLSERREKKIGSSLRSKPQLLKLWKEQEGICPICNQPITKETGWHNHHIVHKAKGGSNGSENRILVHPNCHMQVHAKKVTVSKPCPV